MSYSEHNLMKNGDKQFISNIWKPNTYRLIKLFGNTSKPNYYNQNMC